MNSSTKTKINRAIKMKLRGSEWVISTSLFVQHNNEQVGHYVDNDDYVYGTATWKSHLGLQLPQ